MKISRTKRKKLGFFALVFVLLAFVVSCGLLFGRMLRIKNVDCTINSQRCPEPLQKEIFGLVSEKALFDNSVGAKIRSILIKYPGFDLLEVRKVIPNKIQIVLNEKGPSVALRFERDDNYYLVDNGGTVLETKQTSNLPVLFINKKISLYVGRRVDWEPVINSIKTVDSLRLRSLEVSSAKVVSEKSLEAIIDGTTVIFSLSGDLEYQLDSLQLIFSRTKIEGKRPKKIDLRFDKPFLTYE